MTLQLRALAVRTQLLLLALALAIPAVGVIAFFLMHDAEEAEEAAYVKVNILATNTAGSLDLLLREHGAVLERFASRPQVRKLDPQSCDPLIADYLELHTEATTLSVRDVQGNLVCSNRPNPPTGESIVRQKWFHEGLRAGGLAVSGAYRGQTSGRWLSVLTYPILDAAGKVSGLISFALDLSKVNERVFQPDSTSAVQAVLDREGNYLLRTMDSALYIGKSASSALAAATKAARGGRFSVIGEDGRQRLYAVADVQSTAWRVYASLPEDEVFASYKAHRMRTGIAGLVILVLVLVLTWRISAGISSPIVELARTAERITGGNTVARARVAGPAEIEYVAQQFNAMLDYQARQREERAALVGHYGRLVELARDIFLLTGPDGGIVEANAAAVSAYGYTADELKKMNIRDLRAPEDRQSFAQQWEASAAPQGVLFETMHRRKDGSTFPVEVSARALEIEGQPYRQSFIRDISERKTAEAQIGRMNRAYATLSETNQAIVRLKDQDELFKVICRISVEYSLYECAWVGLVDAANRRVVPAAVYGKLVDYVRQIKVSTDASTPEGRGPTAQAIREGKPYFCQDFLSDPATEPWRELGTLYGIRSSAALPLRRAGAVIGTLNLYSTESDSFDLATQNLLEEMAFDVSFALDNFERESARVQAERDLASSEAYYRGLFENMQEGLAHCRMVFEGGSPQDFIYVDVNEAFARLTGLKDAKGRRVTELIPGIRGSNPELFEIYGRVVETGNPESFETYVPVLDIWFSVSAYRTEPGHFTAVFENITQRKRTEQALREGEERFRSMLEQNISAVFVIEGGKLTYANRRAGEVLGYAQEELIGKSVFDLVVEADRPAIAEASRLLMSGELKTVEQEFKTLRGDGTVTDVGSHAVAAKLQGKRVILGIAQDIGERKKAQAEIARYIARLETTMESTLQAVSSMVELRDPYTAGHERRVGELAAAIGLEMNLPADRLKGLRLAGLVHDIGKISVPAEILSKPSRLTETEFELIKGHCQSGYDVLKGVDFPWPVAQIILQHHERIDGSGYPMRLKADEILLEARIMAVADVVEAMSSHRPYRPGLGLDAALDEIAKNSGRVFDAQVAEACLRLFREKNYTLPT